MREANPNGHDQQRWRFPAVVLAVAVAVVGVAGAAEAPVEVGHRAPAFRLAGNDGQHHELAALRGHRRLVLIFYRGVW
ncbi:MAG: hypothetical protein ACM3O7_00810 [Acidobacteriota bacterium]